MSIYTEKSKQSNYFNDDDDYYNTPPTVDGKKVSKIRNDSSKHYPNKDEAKELRRIMKSTGLSEEEIRKVKKYCIQLSDAQKSGQKSKHTPEEKWCHMIAKKACRITGLPREHPETIRVLNGLLQEASKGGGYYGRSRTWMWSPMPTTAQKVFEYCKRYTKK